MASNKSEYPHNFPCAQARAVWVHQMPAQGNEYAQFLQTFQVDGDTPVRLMVACDSRAHVLLNGHLCGLVLYDGTEDTSWYDTFDLSDTVVSGDNQLAIEVWYQGVPTNNYTVGRPHLIFAVECQEADGSWRCLAASGSDTLCRIDHHYTQGPEVPHNQTGLIWYYDQTVEEASYLPAQCLSDDGRQFAPRPIKRQELQPRQNASICAHGYLLPDDSTPFESAFMSARLLTEALDHTRPYYEIWDCQQECTGMLEVEIETEGSCRVEIGWGEHLDDLRVRSHVGDRYFQTTLTFGPGNHCFRHDFQRIGLRYLELHIIPLSTGKTDCRYGGIRPLMYPVEERGTFHSTDMLYNRIYRTAVRTLRLCMHEHYEDTPWREQALYAMDSLNQALCGYYCFGEYKFAAASLELLGRGLREDGFLELRNPGKELVVIPYFTFMWGVGVRDYYLYSGDAAFAKRMWPIVRRTIDSRLAEIKEGLLQIPTQTNYWNFYEWTELLSGEPIFRDEPLQPRVDSLYQMFFLLLLDAAAWMAEQFGEADYARELQRAHTCLCSACHQLFWDEQDGSYRTFAGLNADGMFQPMDTDCSELIQAMSLLTGVAGPAQRERLLPALAGSRHDWVPCTLSMMRFKYEALLLVPETYTEYVFSDIASIWGKMLFSGATSFWETATGADDFDKAGSLCHGWSAMPVYFYYAYLLGVRPTEPGFRTYSGPAAHSVLPPIRCTGIIPTPEGTIHVEEQTA